MPAMSYADLADCTDGVVTVEQDHLDRAARRVAALLRTRGISASDEAEIGAEGADLLRSLAVAWATEIAAVRGLASGAPDDVLKAKAVAYAAEGKDLAALVDRESLGVAEPGSGAGGYFSIPVGRA